MNTKPSNREGKVSRRFRLSWNLFWFRFAVGRGKPVPAQKFLNRIPLPETAADKAAFQEKEMNLWRTYMDRDDKLCPITWAGIFASLGKAVIGAAVVVVLVWGAYYLTNAFIRLQAQSVHPFQPESTGKKFQLIDGETIVVDMSHHPMVSNRRLYFPVLIFKGKGVSRFYIPDKDFPGELISLSDGSLARKLLLDDETALFYVYNPGKTGAMGTWMQDFQLDELKGALETGRVFFVNEGKELALREKPLESEKPVFRIPRGQQIIFVRFATISYQFSKLVWVGLKYTESSGKSHPGWAPAVSLEESFVDIEVEAGANILNVTEQAISFREAPSVKAAKIKGVNSLKKGTRVEFLDFAPLKDTLSSDYYWIKVRYEPEPGKDYTGWIFAGKIKEKFIRNPGVSKERQKNKIRKGNGEKEE